MSQPTRCHQCQWGTADIPDVVLCPLHAQAPAMREALADLLAWGVELDDDRIGYIIVQVNRGSALAARALLNEIQPPQCATPRRREEKET